MPSNKGQIFGQKKPFPLKEIAQISQVLELDKRFRDLCLFCVGIDTMLRSSDLLKLRVSDVMDRTGQPKQEILFRQTKTGKPVAAILNSYAEKALRCWVDNAALHHSDYLFTAKRGDGSTPITTNYLRRLVKQWAVMIDLDPEGYSGHTLRRTKPAFMYAYGVQPPPLRLLLGQSSLESTQAYLGIEKSHALDLARKYDCFKEMNNV